MFVEIYRKSIISKVIFVLYRVRSSKSTNHEAELTHAARPCSRCRAARGHDAALGIGQLSPRSQRQIRRGGVPHSLLWKVWSIFQRIFWGHRGYVGLSLVHWKPFVYTIYWFSPLIYTIYLDLWWFPHKSREHGHFFIRKTVIFHSSDLNYRLQGPADWRVDISSDPTGGSRVRGYCWHCGYSCWYP